MPELPNLLRQRLAATENGAAPVHPDADMLTAFVEQSLTSTERQSVVAHLSGCEPCREVVALTQSLTAEPAMQAVLTVAPVPRWRRLFVPIFGAAASVAAIAVIAVMVLQLPHKSAAPAATPQAQGDQQAGANAVQDQAAPAEAKSVAPAQPAVTRSSTVGGMELAGPANEAAKKREEPTRTKAAAAATAVVPLQSSPAKVPVLTASLQKKDYVNTNFFASSNANNVVLDGQGSNFPSAPQPQPAAIDSAFSASNNKITIFADLPTKASGKSNVPMLTPAQPQDHPGCTVCKIVQSTARTLHLHSPVGSHALRAGALSNSALGGPGMFSATLEKSQPSEVSAAPERTDVDSFAASGSLTPGALSSARARASDSASSTWKVEGGKLMKSAGQSQWEDAYPVASSIVEFSIVNARASDVWAGGSHAFIIHSRDAGVTWETVRLGENATGTIVSIIAGTLSVQVKTSDNQTWSSADGGKTWTLRGE